MPAIPILAGADGQPPQQLTLPTAWPDVTLAQFLTTHAPGSPHAPALRLSGLPTAVLDELPIEQAAELAQHLAFATDEAALADLLPTPGLLEIGCSAYGLYHQAEKYLPTLADAHPLALGAYLYALYQAPTGSRANEQQLAAAYAAVLAQPVTEVYADCMYFLASYRRATSGTSLPGPTQPGILRIMRPVTPTPQTWRTRLGNLWNPTTHLQA